MRQSSAPSYPSKRGMRSHAPTDLGDVVQREHFDFLCHGGDYVWSRRSRRWCGVVERMGNKCVGGDSLLERPGTGRDA